MEFHFLNPRAKLVRCKRQPFELNEISSHTNVIPIIFNSYRHEQTEKNENCGNRSRGIVSRAGPLVRRYSADSKKRYCCRSVGTRGRADHLVISMHRRYIVSPCMDEVARRVTPLVSRAAARVRIRARHEEKYRERRLKCVSG